MPVALLLLGCLILGGLTVHSYGESWDETELHQYAAQALNLYRSIWSPGAGPASPEAPGAGQPSTGPNYLVLAELAGQIVRVLHPAWSPEVAWHFVYFLTFLAGTLALYLLSLRWMSAISAFGVALLVVTQPLLWGHSLINPKDLPFMALVIITIYVGFRMADLWGAGRGALAMLILGAISLGISSSFRTIGPFAGLIVLGYLCLKRGRRAIQPAALYLCIAAATAFLTYPYLWTSPVSHWLQMIQLQMHFPGGPVGLFAGHLYGPAEQPRLYFPVLLGIQLTEPALLLFLAGAALSILRAFKRQITEPFALFLIWFAIPTVLVILLRTPLYNNGRQLYFILPPLFILAGLALEKLFSWITPLPARTAILLAMALPGIVASIGLHPYEYVYYNSLVGSTAGAYGRYELDYWGTSLEDIGKYVNSHAAPRSNVIVYGPSQIVQNNVKHGIQAVFFLYDDGATTYSYAVVLLTGNLSQSVCPGTKTIYSVGRQGVTFSELRMIPRGVECHYPPGG